MVDNQGGRNTNRRRGKGERAAIRTFAPSTPQSLTLPLHLWSSLNLFTYILFHTSSIICNKFSLDVINYRFVGWLTFSAFIVTSCVVSNVP